MTIRETIEQRISDFLIADDPKLAWLNEAVQKHTFLPLYVGWIAVLGIRPDESFVRLDLGGNGDEAMTLSNPYWQRMSLCQGAKKYPELCILIPERPASAQTCDGCGGRGQLPGAPQLICECGGIGWVIPGESRDCPPG
jgi:hypothetical protein